MLRYEITRWWIISAKDRATEITKSVVPFYHACSSIYFLFFYSLDFLNDQFFFIHSLVHFLSTEYESSSKKKLFFIPKSEIWKFIKKKIKRFSTERDGRKNLSRFRNRSIHHHLFRPEDNHREMLPHARIPSNPLKRKETAYSVESKEQPSIQRIIDARVCKLIN